MPSLLQQLENNEAILLMYLADELPAADRLEVEAMLQTDAGMAAELERLAAVRERVETEMASLDQSDPLPGEQMALRSVKREMTRWILERERESASVDQRRRRFPWWGYPIAAAASIGIVLLIWWGALPHDDNSPYVVEIDSRIDNFNDPVADGQDALDDPLITTATNTMESGLFSDEMTALRQSERDLRSLQALSMDLSGLDEGSL